MSRRGTFRSAVAAFDTHQCIDSAGSLTFFSVLSIFPAMLAILSLFGTFGWRHEATSALLSIIGDVAPVSVATAIRGPVVQVTGSAAVGVAFFAGIVLAIWTASGYVSAFARAMNRIHGLTEQRPYWKRKPIQVLITVVAMALILIVVVVIVFTGPVMDALGEVFGISATAAIAWSIVKWPILAAAVVVMIALLYSSTPDTQRHRFRWFSAGGLVAVGLIVLASAGFGIYVAGFSRYNASYGSLAGIIIFLIWLWIANLALLFGAELDAVRAQPQPAIADSEEARDQAGGVARDEARDEARERRSEA